MARKKQETEGVAGRSLDERMAALESKYGLSTQDREIIAVNTGSLTLDRATGIGGYPLGKVVEIFGPESSGKSTIVLNAIREFQTAFPDRYASLFDFEHSYSKVYAKALGIDTDRLKLYQPDNQENGYDAIEAMVNAEVISLAVIDSHTAAIPKAIIEGQMGDATMALQARKNSLFLGKIKGKLEVHGVTLIGVSQTRANIGGMGHTGDVPTGGNAWKFYSDMRMKVWKILDKGNESNQTTVDVIKNKVSKPYGQAKFNILWGEGIDVIGEVIDACVESGIIKQSGSWYSYDGNNIGQGSEAVKQLLKDNEELYEELKNKTFGLAELESPEINVT